MTVRGKRGGGMRGGEKDSFGLGKREYFSMGVMTRMKPVATTSVCPHNFLRTRTLDGTALFALRKRCHCRYHPTGVLDLSG
jgi:hypothetical protein